MDQEGNRGQLDQPVSDLLVRDVDCQRCVRRHTGDNQGVAELAMPNCRILGSRREAQGMGILQVQGRAVGNQDEGGAGPSCQLRATAEGFIVGVSEHDTDVGGIDALPLRSKQVRETIAVPGLLLHHRGHQSVFSKP